MIEGLRKRLKALQAEWMEAAGKEALLEALKAFPPPYALSREVEETFRTLSLEPRDDPIRAKTGVSLARLAVAATGTILLPGRDTASLLPEISVVLLDPEKIVAHLDGLVTYVAEHPEEHLVAVAGASRTADIEKILVLGAHGPARLVVILYSRQE